MTDTATTPITLRDLIRQYQDRTGESYSEIGRRCDLSKAKIGQLANIRAAHMPRHETIQRLSKGLNLPLRAVQQAAMASAGMVPQDYDLEQRVDILASILRDFPEDDLETVAAVIMSIKERRDRETRPAPPEPLRYLPRR